MAVNDGISGSTQNSNISYVTHFLYEQGGNIYGMEVLLYSNDVIIDKLTVVNESEFDSWTELVTKLSSAYVPFSDGDLANLQIIKDKKEEYNRGSISWEEYTSVIDNLSWSSLKGLGSLETILKNEEIIMGSDHIYPVEINATKFMGMASDEFSKVGHSHNYASKNHSSSTGDYGIGSNELFGHVRVINNLDSNIYNLGESLSAYQGKVLNDKVEDISKKFSWWSSPITDEYGYLQYNVNEDLRLISCKYYYKDFTGLKSKIGTHTLKGKIPDEYKPNARVSAPIVRGDTTINYNTDGTISLRNLTKVNKITINSKVMWHF